MEMSNRRLHGNKVTGKVGISSRESRTKRPQILPVERGRDQCRLFDFHGTFKEHLLCARGQLCNGNTKELRADWREAGTLGFKPGPSLGILICLTHSQMGLQGPTVDSYTRGLRVAWTEILWSTRCLTGGNRRASSPPPNTFATGQRTAPGRPPASHFPLLPLISFFLLMDRLSGVNQATFHSVQLHHF